jgi:hypothetical protein
MVIQLLADVNIHIRRLPYLFRCPDPAEEMENRIHRHEVVPFRSLPLPTYYCRKDDGMFQFL